MYTHKVLPRRQHVHHRLRLILSSDHYLTLSVQNDEERVANVALLDGRLSGCQVP